MSDNEIFLTVQQVADILYLSKSQVYKIINADETFPVVRFFGSIRIPKSQLYQWIEAQK